MSGLEVTMLVLAGVVLAALSSWVVVTFARHRGRGLPPTRTRP